MTDSSKPKNDITLAEARRISVRTLMSYDIQVLRNLQQQADRALSSARLTKDWIDGAINFKLHEESIRNSSDA